MNARILRFPSGAKVIFEGDILDNDGYTLYIWPDQLDETAEITEEDWNYLHNRILERSDNDLSSTQRTINRDERDRDGSDKRST